MTTCLTDLPPEISVHIWKQFYSLYGNPYDIASAVTAVACTCRRFHDEVHYISKDDIKYMCLIRVLFDPRYIRYMTVGYTSVHVTRPYQNSYHGSSHQFHWCDYTKEWCWNEGQKQDIDVYFACVTYGYTPTHNIIYYCHKDGNILTTPNPDHTEKLVYITIDSSAIQRLGNFATSKSFLHHQKIFDWYTQHYSTFLLDIEGHVWGRNVDLVSCTHIQKVTAEDNADRQKRVELLKRMKSFILHADNNTFNTLSNMLYSLVFCIAARSTRSETKSSSNLTLSPCQRKIQSTGMFALARMVSTRVSQRSRLT